VAPRGRRRAAALLVVAVLAAVTGGCEEDAPPATPAALRIATGGRGGVYYAYGEGFAGVVRDHWRGQDATVLETAASVENLHLVSGGKADVAFTLADAAALGVRGGGPFTGPQPIQALARLYDNYVHLVVRADSGIRTPADLRGRPVSTGAPGSGTDLIAIRLLGLVGLDPARDVDRQQLGVDDSVRALAAGELDAFFWSGGLPTRAITLAAGEVPIRLIDLDGFVGPLRDRYGEFYAERTIPASAYGLETAVSTIGVPNYLVVATRMDERVAHELTELLFAHRDSLARAHPEALRLNRRTAIGTYPVPLHPGAARYYRETKLAV
jgi:TRAP transporter TAXI family solute receptor